MTLKIGGTVERVNGKELSYQQFVDKCLTKNEPVLLTGLLDDWRACSDWVTGNGEPCLELFSSHFGSSMVQVAVCGRRELTDQKRVEMSVKEFIMPWLDMPTRQGSNFPNCKSKEQSLLYLKDWHFVKEYPNYVAYTTPPYFVDDWLNLYSDIYEMHKASKTHSDKNDINCSDYRFVYMGPKGTWTPLHADVFRSYSWSANVCGKKQWHFLSPSQCHLLFDRNMKNSVYDIFEDVSEAQFPDFTKAIWLECTQEQNEIIFVPSGWYHQVQNMEDTISINHNWFNAYNLSWVWKLLLKDYAEAKEYIEDIQDISDNFEGLCQRNLAANSGMNFFDFFTFLSRVSFVMLALLHNLLRNQPSSFRVIAPRADHLITNLKSIREVAANMISLDAFSGESLSCAGEEDQFTPIDISKLLAEPELSELCLRFHRTYESIYGGCEEGIRSSLIATEDSLLLHDLKAKSGASWFVEAFGPRVSNPQQLINIIDTTCNRLLGELNDEDVLIYNCKID